MESVHCFRCFRFPSKSLDFYISNCMHIFCVECKQLCQFEDSCGLSQPLKCVECGVQPIRLLKMGPTMPEQVKEMFTPIHEDIQKITKDLGRTITFQTRQRANLLMGLTKKEQHFDRLRNAHNEQKAKKDNYKKQLETAYELLQAKDLEISTLKSSLTRAQQATPIFAQAPPTQAPPPPTDTTTTPSLIRVFSDSMYNQTPKSDSQTVKRNNFEVPAFLRSKSKTCQPAIKQPHHLPPESFKTPSQPAKAGVGFTTPANPPHMFPHLTKLEAARKNVKQRSSQ